MGIEDRDYWRERSREQQGIKSTASSASKPTAEPTQKRSFRIIDKVRVRPENYVPDSTEQPIQYEKPDYSVGIFLLTAAIGGLCFAAYKIYSLVAAYT